jgi:hypothetical protein
MTNKEMSRKQFLNTVFAFFGLFLLSRLPLGGKTSSLTHPTIGTYGNDPYGGAQKK